MGRTAEYYVIQRLKFGAKMPGMSGPDQPRDRIDGNSGSLNSPSRWDATVYMTPEEVHAEHGISPANMEILSLMGHVQLYRERDQALYRREDLPGLLVSLSAKGQLDEYLS